MDRKSMKRFTVFPITLALLLFLFSPPSSALESSGILSTIDAGLSEFNPAYRRLQRNFFRGNTVVELDNSGRFLIPKQMLNYARLEKDVIVVGMGNKVELWNPELYKEQLYDNQNEFSEHVQKYLDI